MNGAIGMPHGAQGYDRLEEMREEWGKEDQEDQEDQEDH